MHTEEKSLGMMLVLSLNPNLLFLMRVIFSRFFPLQISYVKLSLQGLWAPLRALAADANILREPIIIIIQVENSFLLNEGGCRDEKKVNKRMPTPKQKLIHNPIPTSLFLSNIYVPIVEDTAGKIDTFLTKSMFTQRNNKQRCRDGVMNEFLFWCRHPLVHLLFHEVTSLHPPS